MTRALTALVTDLVVLPVDEAAARVVDAGGHLVVQPAGHAIQQDFRPGRVRVAVEDRTVERVVTFDPLEGPPSLRM